MDKDQLSFALQAEYFHLQRTIEDFDGRALTIKAWSVTFGLAAIAGAFASHAQSVFLLSALSVLLFWYLEAWWKSFQLTYYDRVLALESHFRGERRIDVPFQITTSWQSAWKRRGERSDYVAIWPHVALPHAAIFVLGITLYLLSLAGIVKL